MSFFCTKLLKSLRTEAFSLGKEKNLNVEDFKVKPFSKSKGSYIPLEVIYQKNAFYKKR